MADEKVTPGRIGSDSVTLVAIPGPLLEAVIVKVTTSFRIGVGLFTVLVTAMSTPTGMACDAGAEVTLPPVDGVARTRSPCW